MSFVERPDANLDIGQLLDLTSIYALVLASHTDLITLAAAHRTSIAQIYWECVKAQKLIAERVKHLKDVTNKGVKRTEMP